MRMRNRKYRSKLRVVIAALVFIIGIILAAYIGGWILFIKPIIACCIAFDSGTLTALMVGTTVIKAIFAGTVASLIIWVSSVIVGIIAK